MANAIPAPGFQLISGKRAPPKALGDKLYVQIRNGIVSKEAWPVETTRWRWDWNEDGTFNPHPGDVVAIRAGE